MGVRGADMTQRRLSVWLKGIVAAMAVAGLLLYFLFVPFVGIDLVESGLFTAAVAWGWFGFLTPSAVPCYLVLVWCWRAASDIGDDASFTRKNAKRLQNIMFACLADTLYLFIGDLIFFLTGASSPAIFAIFAFVAFAGVVLAVAAGCLSHLVYKAALIREENDGFV